MDTTPEKTSTQKRASQRLFVCQYHYGALAKATAQATEELARCTPNENDFGLLNPRVKGQASTFKSQLANALDSINSEGQDWRYSLQQMVADLDDAYKVFARQLAEREHEVALARAKRKNHTPAPAWDRHTDAQCLEKLGPCPQFEVFIDETGSFVSEEGDFPQPLTQATKDEAGWVALVVGANTLKEPEKGYHTATRHDDKAWDQLLGQVLEAPVAVVGQPAKALPKRPPASWAHGVTTLIRQILWRLPIRTQARCQVTFWVERHAFAENRGQGWRVVANQLEAELLRADPERWGGLRLRIEAVDKDGHPLLAYADALAYLWGSPSQSAKARLEASGLASCWKESPSPVAQRMMQGWSAATPWQPGWVVALLQDPWTWQEGSLASRAWEVMWAWAHEKESQALWVLEDLLEAQAARRLPADAWDRVKAPLKSMVGKKEEWPLAALRAESLRQGLLNHQGTSDKAGVQALLTLAAKVRARAPQATAEAHLVAAVRHLNRFEWKEVEGLLKQWDRKESQLLGAALEGKLHSSLGQAAAFQGQHHEAWRRFDLALAALKGGQEPEHLLEQSRSYQAFVALDHPTLSRQEVEQLIVKHLGASSVDKAIAMWAKHTEMPGAHKRHLLLRFLVQRGTPAQQSEWSRAAQGGVGSALPKGHPWCAIRLQEARLLKALKQEKGARLALDGAIDTALQAPKTAWMQVFALACGRLRVLWEPEAPLPLEEAMLQQLKRDLPALPEALWTPWGSESSLTEALPFYAR